jgi:Holliday junction resolvase RusA-like endonuclease
MKSSEVQFVVNGTPPSVNHALLGGGRYPSKEYKAWKRAVEEQTTEVRIVGSQFYETEVCVYFPLFYKNGNLRKKDIGNYIKYIDDELCKRLVTYEGEGVDDMQILSSTISKVDCKAGEERVEWTIWGVGK